MMQRGGLETQLALIMEMLLDFFHTTMYAPANVFGNDFVCLKQSYELVSSVWTASNCRAADCIVLAGLAWAPWRFRLSLFKQYAPVHLQNGLHLSVHFDRCVLSSRKHLYVSVNKRKSVVWLDSTTKKIIVKWPFSVETPRGKTWICTTDADSCCCKFRLFHLPVWACSCNYIHHHGHLLCEHVFHIFMS